MYDAGKGPEVLVYKRGGPNPEVNAHGLNR